MLVLGGSPLHSVILRWLPQKGHMSYVHEGLPASAALRYLNALFSFIAGAELVPGMMDFGSLPEPQGGCWESLRRVMLSD